VGVGDDGVTPFLHKLCRIIYGIGIVHVSTSNVTVVGADQKKVEDFYDKEIFFCSKTAKST